MTEAVLVYGRGARALHWIMAVMVVAQVTIGIIMVYEAEEPNFWVELAKTLKLYDVHKVQGLVLLALAAARLANRIGRGAPPPEPTLAAWQRETSTLVHAWMYLLLIVVPLLGWFGVSLYPALTVFGSINLPGLVAPHEPTSAPVFVAHRIAAFVLVGLVLMHIGAALFHHFIRGDGVLNRMLPGIWPRGRRRQ